MPYYAVRRGRTPGVYNDWNSCHVQVNEFADAIYMKFNDQQDAEDFVNGEGAFASKYNGLNFDQSEPVTVYTNGSCINNGQIGARAGVGVYWGPDHADNVCDRLPGRQTNHRAEIHAAVKAIQQAKSKRIANLVLRTNNLCFIDGITIWIHIWRNNGWRLTNGEPVVNQADFEELDASSQGINVQLVHAREEPGNEAANILANEGAQKPMIE